MDLTQISTAVTVVKTLADLFTTYKQPVLDMLKESNIFQGNDIITLNLLAENPEDAKTQGKLEGIIETRIGDDASFEDKLKRFIEELKKSFPSDAKIVTEQISEDSEITSEIETSPTAKGNSEITTKDVSKESKVKSTIKRN